MNLRPHAKSGFLSPLVLIAALGLVVSACDKPNMGKPVKEVSVKAVNIEEMTGKKIDLLIHQFGLPDGGIGPANVFQAKFTGVGDTVVVFVYKSLGKNVFVAQNCAVIAVTPTKESLSWPNSDPKPTSE